MESSIIWMALLFIAAQISLASAQTKFVTPGGTNSTRISSPNSPGVNKAPNLHSLHSLIRSHFQQIQADLKSGKITADEAKTERAKVVAIHRQALQHFKDNGKTDITQAQLSDMEQTLSQQ